MLFICSVLDLHGAGDSLLLSVSSVWNGTVVPMPFHHCALEVCTFFDFSGHPRVSVPLARFQSHLNMNQMRKCTVDFCIVSGTSYNWDKKIVFCM